ncbi:hypothetical protein [Streptomyces sp. NPDC005374]|uniref:hypothetical protein n=1 Tax=Streptomyces sp. NPDC005374 TaxID=3364713 RepID=UPI003683F590
MADERPVRRSSKVKVAEFLAGIGEDTVFTKFQLFDGVPGVAQVDRRMRDLRDLGWQIDNYKTDPRLQPDQYRLTTIGTRIDLGEQPKQSPRQRISPARRREALERAGHLCQTCGTRAGERYPDSDQTAVLSVRFIDPTPPVDTDVANLSVECQQCIAGIRAAGAASSPKPDDVLTRTLSLNSREEKRRLYRLMQSGRPERDEVDLIFAGWLRLGRDDRVEVMLQLAGALIEED